MKTKKMRTSLLVVISAAILVSFAACNSLVESKIPAVKGTNSGRSVAAELKVTGIRYQLGDYDPQAEFKAYPDSPVEVYYSQTLANDVYWYTIQMLVEGDINSVTYEVQDVILNTLSEKMTTQGGFVPLNLSVAMEVYVYIYAGKKTYTVHLQKQSPERCIYVSALGNGKNTDDDKDGQRGYSPETAYYSLHNAIAKMKTVGFNMVAVIGVLTSDQYTDGSSTFILDEDELDHPFFIKGFQKSGYDEPTLSTLGSSNKRILAINANVNVTIVGLTFSGAKTAKNGAAIYLESVNGNVPRVFLRGVTIKENATSGNGGGIYTDEGTRLTLLPGTKVYGNKVTGGGKGSGVYHKGAYFGMEGLSYIGTGAPERMVIDSIDTVADTVFLASIDEGTVHPITVSPRILPRSDYNDPGIAAFIEIPVQLCKDGTAVLIDETNGPERGINAMDKTLKNYARFKMIGAPSTSKLWRIDAAGKLASATAYYVGAATAGTASDANDGLSEGTPFLTLEQALYSAASTSVCRKVVVQSRLNAANHNAVLTGPDGVYLHLVRTANTGTGNATFNIQFDPKQTEATAIKIAGLNTSTTESDIVSSLSIKTRDVYFEFEGIKILDSTFSGGSVLVGGGSGEKAPVWFANVALEDKTTVDRTVYGDVYVKQAAATVKTLDNFNIKAAASGVPAVQGVTVTAGSYDFRGTALRVVINGGNAFVTNKGAEQRSVCSELRIEKGLFEMGQSMEGRIYKSRFGDITWNNKDAMLAGNAMGDGTLYFEAPVQVLDSSSNVMEPTAYEVWRANYMSANSGAEPATTHRWQDKTEKPIKLDFTGKPPVKLVKRIVVIGAKYARGAKLFTGKGATKDVLEPLSVVNYRDGDSYDWVIGTETGNLGMLGREFVYGDLIYHEISSNTNTGSKTSFIYKVSAGEAYKVMFQGYFKDSDDPKNKIFGHSYAPSGVIGTTSNGEWRVPAEEDGSDQLIVDVWSDLKRAWDGNGDLQGDKMGAGKSTEAFWVKANLGTTFAGIMTGAVAVVMIIIIAGIIASLAAMTFVSGGMGIGVGGSMVMTVFSAFSTSAVVGATFAVGAIVTGFLWLVAEKFDIDFMRLVEPKDTIGDKNYEFLMLPDKGNTLIINSFKNFVEYQHDPKYRAN